MSHPSGAPARPLFAFAILATCLIGLFTLLRLAGDPAEFHSRVETSPRTQAIVDATRSAEDAAYVRDTKNGKVEARGWVSVSHGDDRASKTEYVLHADDGRAVRLDPGKLVEGAKTNPAFSPGAVIKVRGTENNGVLAVRYANVVGDPIPSPGLTSTQNPRAEDTRSVLVLRVNFRDSRVEPTSIDDVRPAFTGGPDSMEAFYEVASNGTVHFETDFYPDYLKLDIDLNDGTANCEADRMITAAYDAARDVGLHLDAYDHIAWVWAGSSHCQTSAQWEGRHSFYPNTGATQLPSSSPIHEIGHNLALMHAGFAMCKANGTFAPISGDCPRMKDDTFGGTDVDDEYGDETDPMGKSRTRFHAFHMAKLGFLPLANTKDIAPSTSGATYPLADVETVRAAPGSSGPWQLLRIRRSRSVESRARTSSYLYIDARKSTGNWDGEFPTDGNVATGVIVRMGPDYDVPIERIAVLNASPGRERRGRIRDTTALDLEGQPNYALHVGQTLWDSQEDVSITLTGFAADGVAQVEVRRGPPLGNPTTVSASSTLNVTAGAGRINNVVLAERDGRLIVADYGNRVEPGTGCRTIDPQTVSCEKTGVRSASVVLGDKNDGAAAMASMTLPVSYNGGAGRDYLEGGPGDDTLDAGPGAQGNLDGRDADVLSGGGGRDKATYAGRSAAVTIRASGSVNQSDGEIGERDVIDEDVEHLVGGNGADTLSTDGYMAHTLEGGPGADKLFGSYTDNDVILAQDPPGSVPDESIDCRGGGNDRVYLDADDPQPNACEQAGAAPALTITGDVAAGGWTNKAKPSFVVATAGSSTAVVECKIEPGANSTFVPCGASYTPQTALTSGARTLTVRATAGTNVSTETLPFTVDLFTPPVWIDEWSSEDGEAASFSFTADQSNITYTCKVNAEPAVPCVSPFAVDEPLIGRNEFSVTATDRAGNVSPPASVEWMNETPQTTITGGPPVGVDSDNSAPAFEFRSSVAGSTFECSWNGEAYSTCSSGQTKPSSTPPYIPGGPYTFAVRAIAPGGVTDPTSATRTITLNSQTTTFLRPDHDSYTSDSTPWLRFSGANGTDAFECQLDAETQWSACPRVWTLPELAEGLHEVRVRSVSVAGVRSPTPQTRKIFVDLTAPDTLLREPLAVAGGAATVKLKDPTDTRALSGATCVPNSLEACTTFECKLDDAPWRDCPADYTTPVLPDGVHQLKVRGEDPAGNVDPDPVVLDFAVGSQPRSVVMSTPVIAPNIVDLSAPVRGIPVTDWIHWRGLPTEIDRMNVTPQLISTYTSKTSDTGVVFTAPTWFSWPAGAAAPGAEASPTKRGVRFTGNGRGVRFSAPFSSTVQRRLTVYLGVRGTATLGQLQAFSGQTLLATRQIQGLSSTTAPVQAVTIDFRGASTDQSLRVEWTQQVTGDGATAAVVLYGATLS